MSLCRNLVGNVAVITAKAGIGGISALGAGRLGYGSLVLMRAGGNCEIGCRTVGILKSGVILNLNLIAVLGEVKHSYHTLGALSVFSIHGLRIYEHLSHLVAVIADLLSNYYVVGIGVTANDHSDIWMLAQELVPKIVSRIVVGIVRGSVARLASLAESTVALEILVSGNDYAVIRMRCDNLVCPNENVILSSVVKTKKKIINRACLEGMINIVYSTLLVIAGDIARISLVIREVPVKELDAVVTVAANERVRNLAVHKADSLLSGSPLSVCSRLLIILVTYVNAVLGDVTKSDNVLNILGGLIIEYPLINIFKEFGILICYSLSVTDKSKAVGIVVIDRLYVLSLPKKLLVVSVISVAGEICKVGVCIIGIDLVCRDKLGLVKIACVVSSDLLSASHVGVKTELLNEALEVLILSVFPILAVTLCITERGISTDQELLIESVVCISNYILGNGLLKLAVNVAARLATLNVVNNSKMLPSTCSKIYICKSMV